MTNMDVDEILLSVIIPAYNAADTLEDAINSALSQSYPNIEIIVVDDGSSDNTEELMKQFPSRVNYIKKTNGGFASARNLGFKAAKGEYIAWLDSDDIFKPQKLAIQMQYLNKNKEIGAVASNFSAFDEEGDIADRHMETYYSSFPLVRHSLSELESKSTEGISTYKGDFFDLLLHGNFLHPPTLLFRRQLLEQAKPQLENLSSAADYEYIMRLSLLAPLALIDTPLLDYRVSDTQDSSPLNSLKKLPYQIDCMQLILHWPELQDKKRQRLVKNKLSGLFLSLAREQAETSPKAAFSNILNSFKYNIFPKPIIILILLKILTPKSLIYFKRKLTR